MQGNLGLLFRSLPGCVNTTSENTSEPHSSRIRAASETRPSCIRASSEPHPSRIRATSEPPPNHIGNNGGS